MPNRKSFLYKKYKCTHEFLNLIKGKLHVLGILVGGGIVGGWTYTVDWTSSEVREVLSSTEVKGNHKPTSLTLRTKCGLPDKQPSLAN